MFFDESNDATYLRMMDDICRKKLGNYLPSKVFPQIQNDYNKKRGFKENLLLEDDKDV